VSFAIKRKKNKTMIAMKLCLILFCVYQLTYAHVSNSNGDSESKEDAVNTYVQSVQNYWTDERLSQAKPKPMSIDSIDNIRNNANSIFESVSHIFIFSVVFFLF